MKFNIKKLQEGGNIQSPYVMYTPFFQPIASQENTSTPTTSTSPSETKKATDSAKKQLEEVIGEMVGNGLNNEVRYFAKSIDNLLLNSEILGTPISVRQYTNIISQLNIIKNNKTVFDEARKHATETGTLSEVAVTYDGNLYAYDKTGAISLITPENYTKKRNDYKLLTNKDLLDLRNNSDGLIFDNTISQTVAGSMSVDDISTEIDNAIKMIQKEDTSSDLYINKARANEFNKELQALIQNNLNTSPDNVLYKITSTTSTQRNHLNTALVRIWNKLSQQAKNTLIAQAAVTEDGNPRQNAYRALADIITYGTYHKEEIKISDEGDLDSLGNKKGKDGSSSTTELGVFEVYAGEKNKDYTIRFGSDISLTTKAVVAPLVGADDKLQNNKYLSKIISDGGLGGLVDANGASLGTSKTLNPSDLDKILYMNDQVASAWLPSYRDKNGSKVVDLEVLKRKEDADKELEGLADKSEEVIRQVYEKHNVPEYLYLGIQPDPELVKQGLVTQFMIIPAYVPEDVADKVDLRDYVSPLNREERKAAAESYKRLRLSAETKDQRSASYVPGTFWMAPDAIYKTSVFIPFTDDVIIRSIVDENPPLVSKSRYSAELLYHNQRRVDDPTNPKNNIKDTNPFGL